MASKTDWEFEKRLLIEAESFYKKKYSAKKHGTVVPVGF